MAFRRRTAGYRARIRRKARHPSATAALAAWSEYLPSRRASAFAASGASRRLRLLRLVSPPPRHASRWKALMGDMRSRLALPCQGSAGHRNGLGIGVSEKPRRYSVPSKVRSAGMAHGKRCKRRRLRRAKTGMYRQRASGGAKASGARAQSAARARQTPRGGVAGRREVSRPSHASRIRGWMQRAGPKAVARWRSETQPRNAVAPVPTVADNAPAS